MDSLKAQQPGAASEGEALSQDALQSEISVSKGPRSPTKSIKFSSLQGPWTTSRFKGLIINAQTLTDNLVSAKALASAGMGREPTPEEDGVLIAWFARVFTVLDNEPNLATFAKEVLANHSHWLPHYASALEKLNPKPSQARFTFLAAQLVKNGYTRPEQQIVIGRAGTPSRQQKIAEALKDVGVNCTLIFHDILFSKHGRGLTTAEFINQCGEQKIQIDCMAQVNYYRLPLLSNHSFTHL